MYSAKEKRQHKTKRKKHSFSINVCIKGSKFLTDLLFAWIGLQLPICSWWHDCGRTARFITASCTKSNCFRKIQSSNLFNSLPWVGKFRLFYRMGNIWKEEQLPYSITWQCSFICSLSGLKYIHSLWLIAST